MSLHTQYDIVWSTQSKHSGETMPVGGYDTGLNVWVENGEVLFYIDRSGSFDENNQMLKLGRVRLTFDPNPFTAGGDFSQALRLQEGHIEIQGKLGNNSLKLDIWVETHRPIVHIDAICSEPLRITAAYENWRFEERDIPSSKRMSSLSVNSYPHPVTTKPDYVRHDGQGIIFYHRNRTEELVIDKVVEQQGLSELKEQLWNPQINQTFGGLMFGEDMVASGRGEGTYLQTPYQSWRLSSKEAVQEHHLYICLHDEQCENTQQWEHSLRALQVVAAQERISSRNLAIQWWNTFWERSYIEINTDQPDEHAKPWQVGRNYQLFRYMLGCNAYGQYPTKFNGGLFTSDPGFTDVVMETESADFRKWGGGSMTAQNQRLVYWPLLKSGDFELMLPQFEFYNRALGNAQLRTRHYWNHEGCSFTEQLENFGLPMGWAWGWEGTEDKAHTRPRFFDQTEQIAPWIRYQYTSQLEFTYMIITYYNYSGCDITAYLPLIESSIRFFDEHYQFLNEVNTTQRLDDNGKLVIFPSTACETYKNASNPTDVLAALDATIRAVIDLPVTYINDERREYYKALLTRIPSIAFREMDGRRTISPAHYWTHIMNYELPQLYPVFPYGQYGVGRENLQVAIDTWHYGADTKEQKNYISWHQDPIFCARLGLTDEAIEQTILKLEDGPQRFPAFWGPGHDWLPDHNWGGSGMIALQDMLLQCVDETIYLFPAWPADWDVSFKLHASAETTVEGILKAGKLVELKVLPEERLSDIVNRLERT